MPVDVNTPTLAQSPYVQDGRQLQIAAASVNAATATPIHRIDPKRNEWHILSIECSNTSSTDRRLWLTWGGVAQGDLSVHTVPAFTTIVIVDRRRIRNMTVSGYETSGSGALNVYPQADVLIEVPTP